MRLFGKNPVIERLRANPSSIRKIFIQEGFKAASIICKKAKRRGIPVHVVPRSKMQKVGRNINTQGIYMDIDDFQYEDFGDLLQTAKEEGRTLVFLDDLNDPQNLGAIIRSAACLGNFSIVLPTHKSVSVTEAVLRVASGGDNYIAVSQVSNLRNAIKKAKDAGYWIAGSVPEGGDPLPEVDFPFPLGLVIGSEQKGVRDIILKHVDVKVTIPMPVKSMSFNAAHAASIICYEITKQKAQTKK